MSRLSLKSCEDLCCPCRIEAKSLLSDDVNEDPGYLLLGKPWNERDPIVPDNLQFENIGFKGQEAFF
jgi:hypothetical protein